MDSDSNKPQKRQQKTTKDNKRQQKNLFFVPLEYKRIFYLTQKPIKKLNLDLQTVLIVVDPCILHIAFASATYC